MPKRETNPQRGDGRLLPLALAALLCWAGVAAPLFLPVPSLAAQAGQTALAGKGAPAVKTGGDLQRTTSLFLTMLKALGALILIVGLIILFAIVLRKLGWGKDAPGRGGSLIKVLDTRMLAPKKYVAVLQIAGELVAVGVTDQQINLLAKLEPGEELTAALAAHQTGPPALGSFAAIFARARKSGGNGAPPSS